MARSVLVWAVLTGAVVAGVNQAIELVADDVTTPRPASMAPAEVGRQLRERTGATATTTPGSSTTSSSSEQPAATMPPQGPSTATSQQGPGPTTGDGPGHHDPSTTSTTSTASTTPGGSGPRDQPHDEPGGPESPRPDPPISGNVGGRATDDE